MSQVSVYSSPSNSGIDVTFVCLFDFKPDIIKSTKSTQFDGGPRLNNKNAYLGTRDKWAKRHYHNGAELM